MESVDLKDIVTGGYIGCPEKKKGTLDFVYFAIPETKSETQCFASTSCSEKQKSKII